MDPKFSEQSLETSIYLVYGSARVGGEEPLIAVVGDESEALAIERATTTLHPASRVRWETLPVVDVPSARVYVVLLLAGGESGDPIGIGAFRDEGAARALARDQAQPGARIEVVDLVPDWRREGWPFDGELSPR